MIKANSKVWETWPFRSKANVAKGDELSIHLKVILPSLFLALYAQKGGRFYTQTSDEYSHSLGNIFALSKMRNNLSNITLEFSFMPYNRKGKNDTSFSPCRVFVMFSLEIKTIKPKVSLPVSKQPTFHLRVTFKLNTLSQMSFLAI